jgi:hypothetical protein
MHPASSSARSLPNNADRRRMRGPIAERCRSGRSGRSRKPLTFHEVQGFESLPLRHPINCVNGEVSEWPKEHAWKACVGVTPPRVRIPPSPPTRKWPSPAWSPGPVHRRPPNRVRPGREQHSGGTRRVLQVAWVPWRARFAHVWGRSRLLGAGPAPSFENI